MLRWWYEQGCWDALVTLPPLERQNQVWEQVGGQLVALGLDFDEMVVQEKFLLIQQSALAHITQLPDPPQHHTGQFRCYQLLGIGTHALAVDRADQRFRCR